jgi:hypothetical protein
MANVDMGFYNRKSVWFGSVSELLIALMMEAAIKSET